MIKKYHYKIKIEGKQYRFTTKASVKRFMQSLLSGEIDCSKFSADRAIKNP